MFELRATPGLALLALLGACAGPQSTVAPSNVSADFHRVFPASGSCCNIFWNKKRLILRYGAQRPAHAILKYWARNGYYTEPPYCKHGSRISATPGRTWGNPSAYEYVKYSFETESRGPDHCGFTAALNNTGSPPLAVIKLRTE